MQASHRSLEERTREAEVVGFARPLAWSHAELLVALLAREGA